jgi:hypothetical protein
MKKLAGFFSVRDSQVDHTGDAGGRFDGEAPAHPQAGSSESSMRPMPRSMRRIFALEDLEPAARRLLPRPIFGYVAGAAETNASLADNPVSAAHAGRCFATYARLLPHGQTVLTPFRDRPNGGMRIDRLPGRSLTCQKRRESRYSDDHQCGLPYPA